MRVFSVIAHHLFVITDAHLTQHVLDKVEAADKPKREPTAYQVFCKEHMKKWNEENPGRAKEAMSQVRLAFVDRIYTPS